MVEELFTRKQIENAVMLAADLYQGMYNSPATDGGAQEVAGAIIDEAVKMESWLTEKYGKDDDQYLDRLEEYETLLKKKYGLDEQPKQKVWIVTYVGLSDSDYEANGYSECHVCGTLEAAKSKMRQLRDAEIENCKAEGRDYEILEDETTEMRMSWCCHGEQARLEIHEAEVE